MRIIIVGAGSMGMLWAGKLHMAGANVHLIARTQEQAAAIQEHGIAIETAGKQPSHTRVPVQSMEEASILSSELHADWLLLTMKQHQLSEKLLLQVNARYGSRARWIFFQNGTGHIAMASTILEGRKIYAAVSTEAAWRISDCTVMHTGKGRTEWGRAEPSEMDDDEKKLAALWRKAGFENDVSNDIDTAIWNKLLVNACINPLTAILHIRNGELLQHPHAYAMMRELSDEACVLARDMQLPIDCERAWDKLIDVCKATADNRSSMLQDISRGHTTEIDAITGALLWEAEKRQLNLPAHRTVYRMVKALESRDTTR